jgi:hypothetical protein
VDKAQYSSDDKLAAARAWAEFLYDEYTLEKHKQLLLGKEDTTMEKS